MTQSVISFLDTVTQWLAIASWVALGVTVLLLPIAAFRRSRAIAVGGFWLAGVVFFVTLWVLGLYATIGNWGWVGVILGLILAGVGITLTGILSCLFASQWEALFMLLGLTALTIGTLVLAQRLSE